MLGIEWSGFVFDEARVREGSRGGRGDEGDGCSVEGCGRLEDSELFESNS